MKTKTFTLVELLTVIAIIALLAGILIPAVTSALKKADVTKCKAQITALSNAIRHYQATYGKLPIPSRATPYADGDLLTSSEYEKLILTLQNETKSDVLTTAQLNAVNPRHIRFLDVVSNTPGQFLDPWDNEFKIALDANYDDKVSASVNGLKGSTFYSPLIIYSLGPDGSSNSTISNSANQDNIYSVDTKWNGGHEIQK